MNLAPHAARSDASRGRFFEEVAGLDRDVYQRDRDRVIHSTALRRLKHKTQVFVSHEGDHYRTRLTHSLEVAQIARSIARSLGLNEDLAEALALAHDLGHPPFGHAGEEALDSAMEPWGGFDHNAQTLRIVTSLERRYALFDGLNLSWETLEGLVKHNGPVLDAAGRPVGRYAEKGIPAAFADFPHLESLELSSFASIEAQVAAISDDIAYNAHDTDDGLRAGLFDVVDLGDVPIAGPALGEVLATHPDLESGRLIHETVRRMIAAMIADAIGETTRRVADLGVSRPDDVRDAGGPVVGFSPQMAEDNRVLQGFLFRRMYRNERVVDMMDRAKRILHRLFEAYLEDPAARPPGTGAGREDGEVSATARGICDFVAGMTDRYAMDEHRRLFDLDPLFR